MSNTLNAVRVTGSGYTPARRTMKLVNRKGSTIAFGDIVGLNLDFIDTYVGIDPATEADGAAGYAAGVAIACTAENQTRVVAVCLDQAGVVDNDFGNFGISGIFDVKVNAGNKGEFITPTTAQVYATPLTLTEVLALTNVTINCCGICLETTASSPGIIKCIFDGETWRSFFGGDT